jgi:hypothetical protein
MTLHMLSTFDDYPLHQVISPLRVVGTTDRNFYDRYYFNMHNCSDEIVMVAGLGCYPNRGVVDGFVAVRHQGTHYVVRASRTLGAERADTSVGPMSIEVVEGLKTLRLRCEPGSGEVAFDLTWTGAIPAHAEPRHSFVRDGRTVMDMCRFIQTGMWQGSLTVAGNTFEVTPGAWWGTRDRSWGIRPIGEPDAGGIDAAAPRQASCGTGRRCSSLIRRYCLRRRRIRPAAGRSIQAVVVPSDPSRPAYDLGTATHQWTFEPGTRRLSGGTLTFPQSHGELTSVTVEPLVPMFLSLGTGYGGEIAPQPGLSEWRHGMYQGDLVVETPSWIIDDIPEANLLNVIVDHIAQFTTNSGEIGYGMVEYLFVGPNERYGFTGFTDVAQ